MALMPAVKALTERVIHTTSANVSYATQLNDLKTYFNTLSNDDKINCYIKMGSYISKCIHLDGIFMIPAIANTWGRFIYLNIINETCIYLDFYNSSPNVNVQVKSTDINSTALSLCVMDNK